MDSRKFLYDNNELFQSILLPSQDLPASALYVVGLPIGNLGDITLRALWVLSKVDCIAAEDTRETRKLLEKFNIESHLFPVHQHNEHEGAEKVLTYLAEGKRVALVTDAGTPAVSDPGTKVVANVREHGYRVIPIPGASASVTAVSAAGMAPEGFTFHGFLNGGKKERAAELQKLINSGRIFILYEAPHRLEKLIDELSEAVPADRKITIARELTKKFEQIDSLYSPDLHEWLSHNPPKGEYVIVVDAASASTEETLTEEDRQWIDELIPLLPAGQLSSIASKISRFPKKIIYNYIVSKKNSQATVDEQCASSGVSTCQTAKNRKIKAIWSMRRLKSAPSLSLTLQPQKKRTLSTLPWNRLLLPPLPRKKKPKSTSPIKPSQLPMSMRCRL